MRLIILLLAATLTGCASLPPLASVEKDAEAKQFQTESDKANLYVSRCYWNPGTALQLSIDGRIAGYPRANAFMLFPVTPGEHDIAVFGSITGSAAVVQKNINFEKGRNYFIRLTIGFNGDLNMEQLTEEEGKSTILGLSLYQ
jgi:hypothetical protein